MFHISHYLSSEIEKNENIFATFDLNYARSLGNRPFTVAGLHLWNNLHLHPRDSELTLLELHLLLKTHLFS